MAPPNRNRKAIDNPLKAAALINQDLLAAAIINQDLLDVRKPYLNFKGHWLINTNYGLLIKALYLT